jgi:plasmid stabilization system protein ParE
MKSTVSSFIRLLLVLLACAPLVTSSARAEDEEAPTKETTLATIVTIKNLRCDSLRRAKVSTQEALIYRSEAGRLRGPSQIGAERRLANAEAAAGAAFEESGRLKSRLSRLVEKLVSEQRLNWYETRDEAARIRIERRIRAAKSIEDEGCS